MDNPWSFGWTQLLTITGFGITIGIAVGGFRTFGRWKREKLAERRIEVAIDALALAYEATFRFERIRSRLLRESEWADIDRRPPSPDGVEAAIAVQHREGQRGPYAVLKRIAESDEFFERVSKVEPKFMAIFGAATTDIFSALYRARLKVQTAAEALFDEYELEQDPSDSEARLRLVNLRKDIFSSPGELRSDDQAGQNVREFQVGIERLCRPIVDAEFGSTRWRKTSLFAKLAG